MSWEISRGPRGLFGVGVIIRMYKFLPVAVTILATLVNTHTHTHTERETDFDRLHAITSMALRWKANVIKKTNSIFPTTSSSSLILTVAVSGRRHPCSWRSDVHGCSLSATVRFRWSGAAFGTVCHLMSRQLQRSLFFFGIASRHTSSQDYFLHNS